MFIVAEAEDEPIVEIKVVIEVGDAPANTY
jgi:hypothetical protein